MNLDIPNSLALASAILGVLSAIVLGTWFISAQVAALNEHARRLEKLEDAAEKRDDTITDVDKRLARIETMLDYVVASLPGGARLLAHRDGDAD